MIVSFADDGTEDIYDGTNSRKARRKGQHSIAINMQWRICFRWTDRGPAEVEITDYHD